MSNMDAEKVRLKEGGEPRKVPPLRVKLSNLSSKLEKNEQQVKLAKTKS